MQTLRLLIAVLSVAVLGGAADTRAADLGASNAIPSDQIKKKVAPATSSPAAPNAGKTLNTPPGNEQALRNAAQPNVPAPGASPATIPQTGVQTQQLPEADLSGMRRTDGSSPPAGPFGSINDYRPPIYPDARDTLSTSPRNEQVLRDANRPDLPPGAVPGLSLPGTPTTVPGGSTGTTSRENKGSAGGTSGLNNSSALGNANAPGLNQGAARVGARSLIETELKQGRVLDPEVAKTLEEIRPLEDAKLADPFSGANPNADPWQRPIPATPGKEAGSAAAAAGLADGPQGKASDKNESGATATGRTRPYSPEARRVMRSEGITMRRGSERSDGSTTGDQHTQDRRGEGTDSSATEYDFGLLVITRVATGTSSGMTTTVYRRNEATGEYEVESVSDGVDTTVGVDPSERNTIERSQPNESEPQNVGWRGLAPARPVKASNEPRGPLISPVDPDDAIVRVQEEGRRSTAEIKAMVTRPGEGSESGGGDGSGKRDPCRFARPGPDGQLPAGCGAGGSAPR